MPISPYLGDLRRRIGHNLVLTPGVAAIVRDEQGRILVERRSDDSTRFSLPAGAIDPGEAPAQAVVREVWEETGLRVRPTRILAVFGGQEFRTVYPNGDRVEYTVIVFACEVLGGTLTPRDGEAAELAYVEPDRMPDLGLPYPRWLFETRVSDARFDWHETWLPRGRDRAPQP